MASVMDTCTKQIKQIQARARKDDAPAKQLPWPMIVLRSPKGWSGPEELNGEVCSGTFRAHQVPITKPAEKESDLKALLKALVPPKELRMSLCPQSNGGQLTKKLNL